MLSSQRKAESGITSAIRSMCDERCNTENAVCMFSTLILGMSETPCSSALFLLY